MPGLQQDTLALDLGLSQQAISALEQKEALDKDMLEKVAAVLKVPAEATRNFDEETAIYNIQNNFEGSNSGASQINTNNNYCTVNYMGKWMEVIDENKRFYERLLATEREKSRVT